MSAVLDYDGDGLMDIFFTNGAKLPELKKTGASFYNCLLRNKGERHVRGCDRRRRASRANNSISATASP